MKKILSFAFMAMLFAACESNVPEENKHQPADPATWSPVGHKYVSTDKSYYGHYGDVVEFVKSDTMYRERSGHKYYTPYKLEYPYILAGEDKIKRLMFKDTLTITKVAPLADESSCYELVY